MRVKHEWVYREEPKIVPENSIVKYLELEDSLGNEIPAIVNICKRRSYLQLPINTGYTGIASIKNKEHFQIGIDLIVSAIKSNKDILIWGDYDVDGMTSVAVMVHCLKACGAKVHWGVPNRLEQGYGIDFEHITARVPTGSLIITVDNGISDVEQTQKLIDKGYRVLITDHHIPDSELPKASGIVNPKVTMKETDDEYMAPGVYVAAKLILFVAKELGKKQDSYQQLLRFCSSMVAFGIVSDIIDLNPTMRLQLMNGLASLTRTKHDGIRALFEMCGMRDNQDITATYLAYMIIPKLNAAGRMGNPSAGIELLLMDTDTSANYTVSLLAANSLKYVNADRKIIEDRIFDEAKEMAIDQLKKHPNSLILFKKDWHAGVLGIVAARLIEVFYKPTIVLSEERGTIRGSGRSIDNFDLHGALKQSEDILLRFGGHMAAAGVELLKDQLEPFRDRFEKIVTETNISDTLTIEVDTDVTLMDLYDVRFQLFLSNIEPTGKENPELMLQLNNLTVVSKDERPRSLNLILKDEKGYTILVSKFRPPQSYKELVGKKVDILVSPSFTYFTGFANMDWKLQSVRIHETQ